MKPDSEVCDKCGKRCLWFIHDMERRGNPEVHMVPGATVESAAEALGIAAGDARMKILEDLVEAQTATAWDMMEAAESCEDKMHAENDKIIGLVRALAAEVERIEKSRYQGGDSAK